LKFAETKQYHERRYAVDNHWHQGHGTHGKVSCEGKPKGIERLHQRGGDIYEETHHYVSISNVVALRRSYCPITSTVQYPQAATGSTS